MRERNERVVVALVRTLLDAVHDMLAEEEVIFFLLGLPEGLDGAHNAHQFDLVAHLTEGVQDELRVVKRRLKHVYNRRLLILQQFLANREQVVLGLLLEAFDVLL